MLLGAAKLLKDMDLPGTVPETGGRFGDALGQLVGFIWFYMVLYVFFCFYGGYKRTS